MKMKAFIKAKRNIILEKNPTTIQSKKKTTKKQSNITPSIPRHTTVNDDIVCK